MGQLYDDEKALLKKCRQGDENAFSILFNRYKDVSFRVAYRIVGNKEDSLDMVQDAFIKAFGAISTFKEQAKFKNWLLRIVTNTSIDFVKKRDRASHVEYDETVSESDMKPSQLYKENPLKNVERKEMRTLIENAIEQLPDYHKQAFVLNVIEKLSYREISEILDISIGTVMSRLFYARKTLKDILARYIKE